MIVLIAAVPLETELLRREMAPCEVRRCGGQALYQGTLAGEGVALQHSGVGKANAAATAALLLDHLPAEAVICFGCAGAYPQSGLKTGDLVLASGELPDIIMNLGIPLDQQQTMADQGLIIPMEGVSGFPPV